MRWTRRPAAGNVAKYHNTENADTAPSGKLRASVTLNTRANVATLLSTGEVKNTVEKPPPTTLPEMVEALPETAKWAIQNLQHTDNGAEIATALKNHQALAVSDESLKDEFGTSALVIEGPSSHNRIRAVNAVPGPLKEGDSHRCEMAGIYGVVNIVNCIASLHNVQAGSITIAYDNKHALRIFEEDYIPDTKHPDFDLVSATWNLIQESPIKFEGEHVKGHQDDKILGRPYTRQELLNIEMDSLAKAFWSHIFTNHPDLSMPLPSQHKIHGEGWQLWNNDTKINNPNTDNLYNIIHHPITQGFWMRWGHLSDAADSLFFNFLQRFILVLVY